MTGIGPRSPAPDFLIPGAEPACAGADESVFFPKHETEFVAVAVGVTYCHRCPLYARCREWALAQSPDVLYGIWAGTSQEQRRRIRRREQR